MRWLVRRPERLPEVNQFRRLSAPEPGGGEDDGGLSQNDGDEPLKQIELDVGDIFFGREVIDLGFDYRYAFVNLLQRSHECSP